MSRFKVPTLHEIAKLEYQFKLLFFLADLGVASAKIQGIFVWEKYIHAQSGIMLGELDTLTKD